VTRDVLAFVAYRDRQLPPDSSRVFSVMDPAVTAKSLRSIYE
jgi:hypothetical protein